METDVGVEIPKPRFPHRLAKRLLAFRTVPTGPAAITNPQGWAKSDDQSGPNQVDKTTHTSPIAAEALKRIGELYVIEEQIRGRSPEQRQRIRSERAQPLLNALHVWLRQCMEKLFQKSDVARAIHYALELWPSLLRYVNDGRLEIDNNAAERSLRAVALGRKNYLFQGSYAGGEYAAAMYTLIGTAKLNDLDPEAYLSYVLSRIADHPINRLEELFPWNTPVRKTSRSAESEQVG